MKKWKELTKQERIEFKKEFYKIWRDNTPFPAVLEGWDGSREAEMWGRPWTWDADGPATTPQLWWDFCKEEILRVFEDFFESIRDKQCELSQYRMSVIINRGGEPLTDTDKALIGLAD